MKGSAIRYNKCRTSGQIVRLCAVLGWGRKSDRSHTEEEDQGAHRRLADLDQFSFRMFAPNNGDRGLRFTEIFRE